MTREDTRRLALEWLQQRQLTDIDPASPWLQAMLTRTFAVDDYLLHAGDRDHTLFILLSGLVRLFYTTPDGRERNKAFYRGGQLTGAVSAAMTGAPAPFSIQALEPVKALAFSYQAMTDAAREDTAVAHASQQLLAEAFIRNEQREAMLLTCNAEQRYQWLLDQEPDLTRRVAQFHIASYLGIDAVSLSRLKRKIKG